MTVSEARRRAVTALIHEALEDFALTPREHEVALLLALGYSNKEVAAALRLTSHTARRHTESVLRKLAVDSRGKVAARVFAAMLTQGEAHAALVGRAHADAIGQSANTAGAGRPRT